MIIIGTSIESSGAEAQIIVKQNAMCANESTEMSKIIGPIES